MIDLAPRHKQGLPLANPVMNAAGILGYGGEYQRLIALHELGAFVTNPVTLNPRTPARPPNAVELAGGLLIHTGLPNPGLRAALRRHDREWRRLEAPVILHLAATTAAEVALAMEHIERAERVSGVELGLRDDVSAAEAGQLVRAALGGPPLLVRLPLASADALAPAAVRAGADALVVAAPERTSAEVTEAGAARVVGGRRYGPGCFAAALAALEAVAALDLGLPLVAAGGIFSIDAAQLMLDAGAAAVQLDAALWVQPRLAGEMLSALSARA
jgi:dihydroorotate dehydrogenase (NAD+) catalytic subunit